MPGKTQTVSNNITTLQEEDPLCVKWNFKPYNTNFTASVAFCRYIWCSINVPIIITIIIVIIVNIVEGEFLGLQVVI